MIYTLKEFKLWSQEHNEEQIHVYKYIYNLEYIILQQF